MSLSFRLDTQVPNQVLRFDLAADIQTLTFRQHTTIPSTDTQCITTDDWEDMCLIDNEVVCTTGNITFRQTSDESSCGSTGYVTASSWAPFQDPESKVKLVTNSASDFCIDLFSSSRPDCNACLRFDMTILLPSHVKIRHLSVTTDSLNIIIASDLLMSTTSACLSSLSGDVCFPSTQDTFTDYNPTECGFTCEALDIMTLSGSVYGSFSLSQALKIRTLSGEIDITILARKANSSETTTGILELESESGDITTKWSVKALNLSGRRNFSSSIETISGTIRGSYYVGEKRCTMTTVTGNIKVDVIPGKSAAPYNLLTETIFGDTDVNTLDQPLDPAKNLDQLSGGHPDMIPDQEQFQHLSTTFLKSIVTNFRAVHSSISGNVNIKYPATWRGSINATALRGDVCWEHSKQLVFEEFTQRLHQGKIRAWAARTESGKGFCVIRTLDGDVKCSIGERGYVPAAPCGSSLL